MFLTNILKSVNRAQLKPKFFSNIKQPKTGHCLIECNQSKLDHYTSYTYTKLDQVPLASKGWKHSKSKEDNFSIIPPPLGAPTETIPFYKLDIPPPLIDALKRDDINKATQIQSDAIAAIHKGNHVLLAAETGCGKTIAYLLPIMQRLMNRQTGELNTPAAVILVPNRELAYQIGEAAIKLAGAIGLNVKIITGGRTKKIMLNPTFEPVDVLVATPGALSKLTTVGIYKLHDVQFTVLDEADTLIDDSFVERVASISRKASQSQFILVSATLPTKLPNFLAPIEENLESIISDKIHRPLLHIPQRFVRLQKSTKPSHLLHIAKANASPMIVFTNRNETCNWLAMYLRESGVNCANINGDMNYAIRIEQWNEFVSGQAQILAATDVASRGLNTIQVRHVLNYDFPFYAADYLHRIGRVGRLGSPVACKITNFISGPQEIRLVQLIEMAIRRDQPLQNVDGNITNIVKNKIAREMRQDGG